MKRKSTWNAGASFLLIAVLAVMAFIRGPLQILFLSGVFAVWAIWMLTAALLTNRTWIQAKANAYQRKRRRAADSKRGSPQPQMFDIPHRMDDTVGLVLLRHVSYRITSYLKSAYQDVTWEWCDKAPETIIAGGGTARIRLFGVADFNFADVMFDQKANIDCDMMRIVPLAKLSHAAQDGEPDKAALPPAQSLDPVVWYDLQGRQVLEALVADLNSRGNNSLTIKENGDICIKQADTEVTKDKFKSFPAKVYWPGIAKVMENAGLAAAVEDSGIVVSW